MTVSRFYLCAVPKAVWEEETASYPYTVNIHKLVEDALGSEKRFLKEVNLENEYWRYSLTCQKLENEIAVSSHIQLIENKSDFVKAIEAEQFPTRTISSGYLSLIAHTADENDPTRIGASFHAPDTLHDHIHEFDQWAEEHRFSDVPAFRQVLTFFEQAHEHACGVIEYQSAFHPASKREMSESQDLYLAAHPDEDAQQEIEIPEFEISGESIEFFGGSKKQADAKRLRDHILHALKSGEPIIIGSEAKHDVITEVLHDFVFVPEDHIHRNDLRIAYVDGSEAEAFPIYCLPKREVHSNSDSLLRAALMSMRHLELDSSVDFCWFRNREVSQSRILAETDAFCFKETLFQLRESLEGGDVRLQLYHTGFEPAVLGFYRGLVHILLEQMELSPQSALAVTPQYYRGKDGYEAGSIWGTGNNA